jgi:hypothetical protein
VEPIRPRLDAPTAGSQTGDPCLPSANKEAVTGSHAGSHPRARLPATFAEDGIDTFVYRDGLIQVQTARYTPQRNGGRARLAHQPPATAKRPDMRSSNR